MFTTAYRILVCSLFFICSCSSNKGGEGTVVFFDTAVTTGSPPPSTNRQPALPITVAVSNTTRESIVSFAESLIGTPYKYASSDPDSGFDCSGFITYVFNHFNIKVPRSSVDFTNVGREVNINNAKRGDLILFTGTDSTLRIVGHMGIVTSNTDTLKFIHSTSGKVYGVTITPFSSYYKGRFVKVIDIF